MIEFFLVLGQVAGALQLARVQSRISVECIMQRSSRFSRGRCT